MHLVFLLLPASDLRPRGPEARGGRVARAVEWAGGDNQWEEGDGKSWGRSAVGIGASDKTAATAGERHRGIGAG